MHMATEPTERELQILKILWSRGEGTVREVYDQMSQVVADCAEHGSGVFADDGGKRAGAASRGRAHVHLSAGAAGFGHQAETGFAGVASGIRWGDRSTGAVGAVAAAADGRGIGEN